MKNKNILILKNDRAGDFLSSVKLIHELKKRNNNIRVYLSNLNYNFRFLVPDCNYKQINLDLKFKDKIKIFLDILKNKYDEIFILSPRNFYFFLPIFFWKVKFYAIVINGKKRNRPVFFLRKLLYKINIRYRNKINKENIIQSNLSLININRKYEIDNLNLDNSKVQYFKYISDEYIFFQFKKSFFEHLQWNEEEFKVILNLLSNKYKNVVFSSDIDENEYDNYFYKNFNSINFKSNYEYTRRNNNNIIYLKQIDPLNLFLIIQSAKKIIGPHGLITQASYLLKKKSVNLFNFKINDLNDYHHEKISFSEWYSNMGIDFILLNNDVNKALKKISKFI